MRLWLVESLFMLVFAVAGATMAYSQQATSPKPAPLSPDSAKAQAPVPQTVFVEAADDGKQITLRRGVLLQVRLEANPSTGYAWGIIGDPVPLVLVSAEYGAGQSNQQKPGAPEMQVLRFKADVAGSVELNLGYRRPWKKREAPAKTFHINVTVTDGPPQ